MAFSPGCVLSHEASQKFERAMRTNTPFTMDVLCDSFCTLNTQPSQLVLHVETIRIRPIVFALHNRLKHAVDMLLLRGFDEMLSYNTFCHVLADDCPGLNRTSEQISDDERLKQERSAFIREQLKELRRNHCLLPDIWDIVRSYWTSFS